MKVQVLNITKDTAAHWLTKNDSNRKADNARIAYYTRQMNDEIWLQDGAPIRFSGDYERLLDGQHRLTAFIKSDLDTLEVVVITELQPEAFYVMDMIKPRTPADALHIQGYVNTTDLATTVKIAFYLKKGVVSISSGGVLGNGGKHKITPIETAKFISENPKIIDAVRLGQNWYKRSGILRRTQYAAFYFVFAEKDEAAAFAFFDQLSSGLNLTENSPIYQLRRKLEQDKVSAAKLVGKMRQAIIITCWNAYRRGAEMKMIRVNYEADLPEIL